MGGERTVVEEGGFEALCFLYYTWLPFYWKESPSFRTKGAKKITFQKQKKSHCCHCLRDTDKRLGGGEAGRGVRLGGVCGWVVSRQR